MSGNVFFSCRGGEAFKGAPQRPGQMQLQVCAPAFFFLYIGAWLGPRLRAPQPPWQCKRERHRCKMWALHACHLV